jgi:inositol 1,4,5-triphosphate receptor type 1/inositol 1,4,5-triphosphate receptor type 3
MSPKLTYICTSFQILAALIDTSNKVNIGKLIKRYPFDTLVEFLIRSKTCWPLKRNLRSFINRLYYFHPEIDSQLKIIFSKEMPNFIEDLNQYIEEKFRPDAIKL